MQIDPVKIREEVQVDVDEVFEITGTSYADLNITLMNQPLAIKGERGYQFINTIVQLIVKNTHQQLIGSVQLNCLATNEPTMVEVLYDSEQRCWYLTEQGEVQLRGRNT